VLRAATSLEKINVLKNLIKFCQKIEDLMNWAGAPMENLAISRKSFGCSFLLSHSTIVVGEHKIGCWWAQSDRHKAPKPEKNLNLKNSMTISF
jgi:hypothetical protein